MEQAPGRTSGAVERGAHDDAAAGRTCGPAEVSPFLKDCTRGRGPRWGSSRRSAACGRDSHWRFSQGTVSHEREPTLGQRRACGDIPGQMKVWQRQC